MLYIYIFMLCCLSIVSAGRGKGLAEFSARAASFLLIAPRASKHVEAVEARLGSSLCG